jgi:hypothetical protein
LPINIAVFAAGTEFRTTVPGIPIIGHIFLFFAKIIIKNITFVALSLNKKY